MYSALFRGSGIFFDPVESAISSTFLPAVFDDAIDPTIRRITALPVKYCGLGLPNPATTCSINLMNSQVSCSLLISAMKGDSKFCYTDHLKASRDSRNAQRIKRNNKFESQLSILLSQQRVNVSLAALLVVVAILVSGYLLFHPA